MSEACWIARTDGQVAMYRKRREEEQVALIRNHDNKWMNENTGKTVTRKTMATKLSIT